MPLIKGKSKKAVSQNIKTEMAAGKSQKQAVAIALDIARRAPGGAVSKPSTHGVAPWGWGLPPDQFVEEYGAASRLPKKLPNRGRLPSEDYNDSKRHPKVTEQDIGYAPGGMIEAPGLPVEEVSEVMPLVRGLMPLNLTEGARSYMGGSGLGAKRPLQPQVIPEGTPGMGPGLRMRPHTRMPNQTEAGISEYPSLNRPSWPLVFGKASPASQALYHAQHPSPPGWTPKIHNNARQWMTHVETPPVQPEGAKYPLVSKERYSANRSPVNIEERYDVNGGALRTLFFKGAGSNPSTEIDFFRTKGGPEGLRSVELGKSTGGKEGLKVLATVKSSVKNFIDKEKPEQINFLAGHDDLTKTYERFAKQIAKEYGAQVQQYGKSFNITFPWGNKKAAGGKVKSVNINHLMSPLSRASGGQAYPDTYTLKKGDNPGKVAKRFGLSVKSLMDLNNLDDKKARKLPIGFVFKLRDLDPPEPLSKGPIKGLGGRGEEPLPTIGGPNIQLPDVTSDPMDTGDLSTAGNSNPIGAALPSPPPPSNKFNPTSEIYGESASALEKGKQWEKGKEIKPPPLPPTIDVEVAPPPPEPEPELPHPPRFSPEEEAELASRPAESALSEMMRSPLIRDLLGMATMGAAGAGMMGRGVQGVNALSRLHNADMPRHVDRLMNSMGWMKPKGKWSMLFGDEPNTANIGTPDHNLPYVPGLNRGGGAMKHYARGGLLHRPKVSIEKLPQELPQELPPWVTTVTPEPEEEDWSYEGVAGPDWEPPAYAEAEPTQVKTQPEEDLSPFAHFPIRDLIKLLPQARGARAIGTGLSALEGASNRARPFVGQKPTTMGEDVTQLRKYLNELLGNVKQIEGTRQWLPPGKRADGGRAAKNDPYLAAGSFAPPRQQSGGMFGWQQPADAPGTREMYGGMHPNSIGAMFMRQQAAMPPDHRLSAPKGGGRGGFPFLDPKEADKLRESLGWADGGQTSFPPLTQAEIDQLRKQLGNPSPVPPGTTKHASGGATTAPQAPKVTGSPWGQPTEFIDQEILDRYLKSLPDIYKGNQRAAGGPAPTGLPPMAKTKGLPAQSAMVTRAGSANMARKSGFLASSVPGRTDKLNLSVKSGSYVVPADVVAGHGQGNSLAGARRLDTLFKQGPYGSSMSRIGAGRQSAPRSSSMSMGRMSSGPSLSAKPPSMGNVSFLSAKNMVPGPKKRSFGGETMGEPEVPVMAAGGEYIIDPEVVAGIGGGNSERGFRILDQFVLSSRKKHIKTLKGLKPPKKD